MAIARFTNLTNFIRGLTNFQTDIAQRARRFRNRVGQALIGKMIKRTPVRTGRARGNWDVTDANVGAALAAGADETKKDPEGNRTIARAQRVLRRLPDDATVNIVNPVPYIQFLENGGSPQAPPGGIVEISIAEVNAQFANTRAEDLRFGGGG